MNRTGHAALLIAALLVPSLAAPQAAGNPDAARRSQIVSAAPRGSPFLSGSGQTYQVLVGLRAVARSGSSPEERLAALGIPASDLVATKGPFVVFQRPAAGATRAARVADASAVSAVEGAAAYPVVVNVRAGGLGVLPGIAVAKLRRAADAEALAADHGLALEFVGEQIRTAFLRVPAGRDVVAASAALAKDRRVETAYPEVREHFAVPR